MVECAASYSDNLDTALTNVTLKIKDEDMKEVGKEFLREGMFYISPEFGGNNPPQFVFETNINSVYLTKNIVQKRNYWANPNTNITSDDINNILNGSNLVFFYATKDDKEDLSNIIDTIDNVNNYCSYQNPDAPNPSPVRDMFQTLAKLGVVDMYIASVGRTGTDNLLPQTTSSNDLSKGKYLCDDDNLSQKLVPEFREFSSVNDDATRYDKLKFTWTVTYLGDNKFTMQNKFTGRFLKAFNYFDSTYVYVGDSVYKDYNSYIWYIQNIFPNNKKEIVQSVIDDAINQLKKSRQIKNDSTCKNYLQAYFCGSSSTFIDGVDKINSNFRTEIDGLNINSKMLNNYKRINLYSKICVCNMNSRYNEPKNASFSYFLELLQLKNNYCSLTRTEKITIANNIQQLRNNLNLGTSVCSDIDCRESSKNFQNIVEELDDPAVAEGCGNSTTCISTSTYTNNGIVIDSPFFNTATQNCGNNFTLSEILVLQNMAPTLVYNSKKGNNKLWQYTQDCYNASERDEKCSKSNDYSDEECVLTDVKSACQQTVRQGASEPTLRTNPVYNNGIRTVVYDFTGTPTILPNTTNVDINNTIGKNQNLYVNKILNKDTTRTINNICDRLNTFDKCFIVDKDISIPLKGKIEIKEKFNCGEMKQDICTYNTSENRWIREKYYGEVNPSTNSLKDSGRPLLNLNGVSNTSEEFREACIYDFNNKQTIGCDEVKDCEILPTPQIGPINNDNVYENVVYTIRQRENLTGRTCKDVAKELATNAYGTALDSSDPGIYDSDNNPTTVTFRKLKNSIDCNSLTKNYGQCFYDNVSKRWRRNFTYQNQSTSCGREGTEPCNETKECSISSTEDLNLYPCGTNVNNTNNTIGYKILQYGNTTNPSDLSNTENCKAKATSQARTKFQKDVSFNIDTTNYPSLGDIVKGTITCDNDCKVTLYDKGPCMLDAITNNYSIKHTYLVTDKNGNGNTCENVIRDNASYYKNSNPVITRDDSGKIQKIVYNEPCQAPPGGGTGGGTSGGTGGGVPTDCQLETKVEEECISGRKKFSYKIKDRGTRNNCMTKVRELENSIVFSTLTENSIDKTIEGYTTCSQSGGGTAGTGGGSGSITPPTTPPTTPPVTPKTNTYVFVGIGAVLILILILAIYKVMKM